MIRRNTWILLAAFALLLVAAVYLQRSGGLSTGEEDVTPTVEQQQLLDVDAAEISSFQIKDAQGKEVSLMRDAQGAWALTEPPADKTDSAKVDSAVVSLASLEVLNTLETGPALDVVGLTKPNYTLQIGMADGSQHVIEVGEATPTGTGYYARMDGGTPVVVSKSAIDSAAELLTTPPVIATETPTAGPSTPGVTGTPASVTPSP
jgi:uncharacterized protein DUF4340